MTFLRKTPTTICSFAAIVHSVYVLQEHRLYQILKTATVALKSIACTTFLYFHSSTTPRPGTTDTTMLMGSRCRRKVRCRSLLVLSHSYDYAYSAHCWLDSPVVIFIVSEVDLEPVVIFIISEVDLDQLLIVCNILNLP